MAIKIIVLGASKGTGALAVKEALGRGHSVSAFARTPERLAFNDPKLTLVRGDFHDEAQVHKAVAGHDAVVICPGVTALSEFKTRPDYFSRGTGYAIEAMKAHGVLRLVILSALGTGPSRPLIPVLMRPLLLDWILRGPFRDHEVQERQARESGLAWVIARPSRLTDGPARHRYVKTAELTPVPNSISRADVAHFLIDACDHDDWVGTAVQLGG